MTTRVKGSSNNGSYLYVDYNIVSQNVAGNYTDVSWTVGVHWGTYYFNIHDAKVTMSTTTGDHVGSDTSTILYNSGWPISGAGPNRDHPFDSGTTRIYHTNAGIGNLKFSGSAFWDTPSNFTSTISIAVSLPTIPRISGTPSMPIVTALGSTTASLHFNDGTGGAPIDSREIAVSVNLPMGIGIVGGYTSYPANSSGNVNLTGLTPGQTYYIWARTHNTAGYSNWSARNMFVTLNVPAPPSAVMFPGYLTQTEVDLTWSANDDGGVPITNYEIGYALNSVAPTSFSPLVSATTVRLTGLAPGTRYYFWVRAKNSIGYSAWSFPSSITTIAGARVKIGTVWKQAIPYVRVGGVWKLARPWTRISGTWKETQ